MPLGFNVGGGGNVYARGSWQTYFRNVHRVVFLSTPTENQCSGILIDGVCAPGPAGLERAVRL